MFHQIAANKFFAKAENESADLKAAKSVPH
jgi:hypothetical protein